MKSYVCCFVWVIFIITGISETFAQSLQKGTVVRVKVHGKSLEGNLSGDSPDRFVSIYLPPGYSKNPQKRYSVVYFLHGFTDSDSKWYGLEKHWINLSSILDTLFSNGNSKVKEMIFVTPDAYTQFQGSFYSNSITTGNWEDFVAKELPAYIDSHYRTIRSSTGRGLAGHSMGGYGSLRIGQKYPEVFSSIYLLSPAVIGPEFDYPNADNLKKMTEIKNVADVQKSDFFTKAIFSLAAAWSPDPGNDDLHLQLPFKNGEIDRNVQAKWTANLPLVTLDQYIFNLKKLKAISFDAGNRDEGIAKGIKILDKELDKYSVKHGFEIYEGDHINKIGERIKNKMVFFFSHNLASDSK